MQLGRCCLCENARVLTIKGLDITDGTTQWEYGPGSWWRHHYGPERISGVVPDIEATLDRFVIAVPHSSSSGGSGTAPVRSASAPEANCTENLTLTKLNSTDGTVVESALCEGLFSAFVGSNSYGLANWIRFENAVALSGGDYLIVGRRNPAVEFVDFTSNTASKTYILHAHNMQAGNVYLKTRTSDETITLAYNTSAASVKTAFEATADCTAATCTGGPWPHASIQVDATWSVSTGDIKSITMDHDYMVGGTNLRLVYGTATTYSTSTGLIQNSAGHIFGADVGAGPSELIANPGVPPIYSDYATCEIFEIVSGPSNSVVIKPLRDLGATAAEEYIDCFTVANPWTRNWQKYTNVDNCHLGTNYTFQLHHFYAVQAGSVLVYFNYDTFTGGNRGAASIVVSSGAVTELDTPVVSLDQDFSNNRHMSFLHDGSTSTLTTAEYDLKAVSDNFPNINVTNHFEGSEISVGGDEMLIGMPGIGFYGSNATHTFGLALPGSTRIQYLPPATPSPLTGDPQPYQWSFLMTTHSRLASGTQWRFQFSSGVGILTSAWINWYCTAADVQAAIVGVFGETTDVGETIAEVYPFGTPATIVNTDFAPLQEGLDIIFNAYGTTGGGGQQLNYPPGFWFRVNRVTIQFQTVTQYNTAGFGGWVRSNANIYWQRNFGTIGAATVREPRMGWINGSWVYVAGDVVDAELP